MGNRKAFVTSFLADLEAIVPNNKNDVFYVPYFESLNDKQFEQMVESIEAGELILPLVVPNLSEARISVKNNLAVGKKWGHEFFQHLFLTDATDPSVVVKTPERYLMIKLPVRRPAQTLEAKMAVPENANQIDDLSGQNVGASKGAGVSSPEVQILYQHGCKNMLVEFLKVRGGDAKAYRILENELLRTGQGDLLNAIGEDTSVKSKETLSALLKASHLGNAL